MLSGLVNRENKGLEKINSTYWCLHPCPSQDHLETHCKHFSQKGLLLNLAHSGRASLSPPGMVLSFSEPYSIQMRPHIAFHHITSVPWKVALRWYRIKSTGIWFVFPPVIIRSSASESVQLYSPGNQVLLCPSRNLTQPLPLWKALWFPCQWRKGKPGR